MNNGVESTPGCDDVTGLGEVAVRSMTSLFKKHKNWGKKWSKQNFRPQQILIPKSDMNCFFYDLTASLKGFRGHQALPRNQ